MLAVIVCLLLPTEGRAGRERGLRSVAMNLRMSLTDGRGGSHSVDEAVGAQGGWRLTECTAPGEAKPRGRPCGPCTRLSDAAPSFLEVSEAADSGTSGM